MKIIVVYDRQRGVLGLRCAVCCPLLLNSVLLAVQWVQWTHTPPQTFFFSLFPGQIRVSNTIFVASHS